MGMTDREKAIIMAYTGYAMLTGDKLGLYYQYVQEKIGRPVMTHELADKPMQETIHTLSKPDFVELCRTNDEPRVLSLDEVKALGDRECIRSRTTDIEPVWVEERSGRQTRIEIGLIWYDSSVEEWMDKDEWTIYAKRFGTDYDTLLSVLDYGKTWRVWSTMLAREQRKAVKWND